MALGVDYTGQKFGRLTILKEGSSVRRPSGKTERRMVCECECGTRKLVRLKDIRSGCALSCGCLRRERVRRGVRGRNQHMSISNGKMRTIVDGFLGWTTEYLNFVPVSDTYALVDEDDFIELSRMNWSLKSHRSGIYYARKKTDNGKSIQMHQIILPVSKGFEVDHKNRNGLDNRRENLRPATSSQNNANQRTIRANKKHSRFKGVTKRGSKWRAVIGMNGKQYRLGTFADEQEAARAYNEAAKKLFGEFAFVNSIPNPTTNKIVEQPQENGYGKSEL